MPKGYWIARISVEQPERYDEYKGLAGPAYQAHGAKFLVRGGKFDASEGEARERNVVIEFPTYQAALDCYNSQQYAKARAVRQEISVGELIVVEGAD
ncbi:MAG: DUF1330 domain-containing protein [Pseudomonadota bacterium]